MHNTNVLLFLHMYIAYTSHAMHTHRVQYSPSLTNIEFKQHFRFFSASSSLHTAFTVHREFFFYVVRCKPPHNMCVPRTLTFRCYFPFVCDMTTIYSLYIQKCFVYGISLCAPLSRVWCCSVSLFALGLSPLLQFKG